jgi:hypothetical protein
MPRPDPSAGRAVWRRFRPDGDRYVRLRQGALYVARVAAIAERTVDLLHTLSAELDDAVDVRIDDVRRGRVWIGRELPRGEVREALLRLKLPLAASGGVEVTLVTPQDQLTVTPELLLFAAGRSDRWWRLLDRFGLRAARRVEPAQWIPDRAHLRPVRELGEAIDALVRQLELRAVAPPEATRGRPTPSGEGPAVRSGA